MTKLYGTLPVDLGEVDISPDEMMFWLYCPVKMPLGKIKLPDNLIQFMPILDKVKEHDIDHWDECYAYVTAKTLWVNPENVGNRKGWHSDGFMTDDINYIWFDCLSTEFMKPDQPVALTQNHVISMKEMEDIDYNVIVHYENKHLLKLDESVIHRVAEHEESCYRTFVKISLSRELYNLKGNSINHKMVFPQLTGIRKEYRNCPTGK